MSFRGMGGDVRRVEDYAAGKKTGWVTGPL